jgi:radical SAM superfamily enzyme YgiQ (UPF0313 family)
MGGGFVNTELRELAEPRVFDHIDYVVLDDGEVPLLRVIKHVENKRLPLLQLIARGKEGQPTDGLTSVFVRQGERVVFVPAGPADGGAAEPGCAGPVSGAVSAVPRYDGLPLGHYFSMVETPNPMQRLWFCGRWNKLALAHGCYWRRCAFCDTSLDYIRRYEPLDADRAVSRIKAIMAQTGQSGFHFVDEAMPPALLRALAERLIEGGLQITWWGNIRFDAAFTPELAGLLARSGCVAVSGGLEAATDRLLQMLDKGYTLDQAARVTRAFAQVGVMVHAYLMYGCPSETVQETIDALEYVRQLFEAGCIQSAYWHRFALTVHSPICRDPARYGIELAPIGPATFARNEVPFIDPAGCDHDALGRGLRAAVYNYMHGIGTDHDLARWFAMATPAPTLPPDSVARSLCVP